MQYLLILALFFVGYWLLRPKLVQIVIQVKVPTNTPDKVYMCGSLPELGQWQEPGLLLTKKDAIYETQLSLKPGQSFEFKFTLGDWSTVEKSRISSDTPNRLVNTDPPLVKTFEVARFNGLPVEPDPSLKGNFETLPNFKSSLLDNTRNVIVYLPPSYKTQPEKRYPVLYMHDGNNLFDASTAFAGVEWGVDDAAEDLIRAGSIEEIIIVGIYNTIGRMEEYTPVVSQKHGGGKGSTYLRFITEELMPHINLRFRTKTGPESTAIMGSSLGGLISLYAGFAFNDHFGMAGAVSPSLWWANQYMEKDFIPKQSHLKHKIWLDMGSREGMTSSGISYAMRDVRQMNTLLQGMGYVQGKDLFYFEHENASHDEASWASRVHMPLLFFFGTGKQNIEINRSKTN